MMNIILDTIRWDNQPFCYAKAAHMQSPHHNENFLRVFLHGGQDLFVVGLR